jgi:transposase
MIRLTDEQWERIRNHFPEEHIADGRPGRKPIPTRRVLAAVLWLLNTGAQWHMLPLQWLLNFSRTTNRGSVAAATIRSFSVCNHRERRCTEVILQLASWSWD